MKLGSIGNFIGKVAKPTYTVKELKKAEPSVSRSVRDEVILRRKKEKQFSIVNMVKTSIEKKIDEKIKDFLDIRF